MSDRAERNRPRISFGVPVRNEEGCIGRCLDSIVAQDCQDFEVVISDNASTDRTMEILRKYAERDSRIRLFENESNIGLIENCNKVVRLAEGEFFRWVGADDWIEPSYASRCIAAFEADPEVIAVTTGFANHDDRGNTVCTPYYGELMESPRPSRRFKRMLWSFHAGDSLYDPVYGMFRRDVLIRSSLLRVMEAGDAMLAAELSLVGRFAHIPECLTHRWKPYRELSDIDSLFQCYHPVRYKEIPGSALRFIKVLTGIVWRAELSAPERLHCMMHVLGYGARESKRRGRLALRSFLRDRLGVRREQIPFLGRRAEPGQ